MKRIPVIAAAISAVTALGTGLPVSAVEPQPSSTPEQTATFEGTTFDMSNGWGAANACNVTDSGTTCYRTEAEMDKAIRTNAPATRASSCSSSLRLYDGTGHSGAVVNITSRGSVKSLSSYGFDNRTSSYRVGACSSRLYNGIGTSQYGGNTSAGASATSMASGWNNVISSVYLS